MKRGQHKIINDYYEVQKLASNNYTVRNLFYKATRKATSYQHALNMIKIGFSKQSKVGNAILFHSQKERDEWMGEYCPSAGGRIACTCVELRRLCAGLENKVFAEYLEYLQNN